MSLHWSVNILPSRKVFIISGNQREKTSVQIISHRTTGLWQVWSEQTALLNIPLWCLGMLVRKWEGHLTKKSGYAVKLQRLCFKTEKLLCSRVSSAIPWISDWFLVPRSFPSLPRQASVFNTNFFHKKFSYHRPWQIEIFLVERKTTFSTQTLSRVEKTLNQTQAELKRSVTCTRRQQKQRLCFKAASRETVDTSRASSGLYLQEAMPGGK